MQARKTERRTAAKEPTRPERSEGGWGPGGSPSRGERGGRSPPRTRTRRRRPVARGWKRVRVYALGHSTRPREELVALLHSVGVKTLVDIRTVPRSRTNPQFNREVLAEALPEVGIAYRHVAALGGLRRSHGDSPNAAWRNASFRAYADHLATDEFQAGLEELRTIAREGPVAITCAEALPWRCHRSIVADALFARGVVVEHIEGKGRTRPHVPPPFAVFRGTKVTYPAPQTTVR